MVSILAALVGVFVGAWINNIIAWKIKNKVESLDALYVNIAHLYNYYVKANCLEDNIKPNEEDVVLQLLIATAQYKLILDNKFSGDLEYLCKGVVEAYNGRCNKDFSFQASPTSEKYSQVTDSKKKLSEDIVIYRNKLTSFCYIFKQLNPCNWKC